MTKELHIAHLYPDVLNLYGDCGDITALKKRLEWRGMGCTVTEKPIGAEIDFDAYDLYIIGGGQDFEQTLLLEDLKGAKADGIRSAVEDGKTFLCICGGFQLMGHWYETADGVRCEYLGAADFVTVGSHDRLIGNYAFRLGERDGGSLVTGFENHGGRTELGAGAEPLGTVLAGYGNNGRDGTEGVRYRNLFGTYCHGPALPKNPLFCDLLLSTALERKYGDGTLEPLDDAAELAAQRTMLERLGIRG